MPRTTRAEAEANMIVHMLAKLQEWDYNITEETFTEGNRTWYVCVGNKGSQTLRATQPTRLKAIKEVYQVAE